MPPTQAAQAWLAACFSTTIRMMLLCSLALGGVVRHTQAAAARQAHMLLNAGHVQGYVSRVFTDPGQCERIRSVLSDLAKTANDFR